MREIKFRAWNYKISKMLYNVQLCGHSGKVTSAFSAHDYPVMQYTGLTDKEGVELYEGDIIENEDLDKRLILYCLNGFEMRIMNGNRDSRGTTWHFTFKIIGNIHENPELL